MTVRVTTLKGPDAGAYYVEHLPRYYLAGDEPDGVWQGRGANRLTLAGNVHDDAFLALMAGHDPRSPGSWLGSPHDERSVRGFDVTASAPKSVSLLFALGDERTRRDVLEAHDAAVAAMCDWVERHAHTRYRVDGKLTVVDAQGIVAAKFRQHTSRALDPQLHTHLVVVNRVMSPDGRWLTLDARTIKRDQRTLSAIYHAGLRAELVRRLGVRWELPVNGIAEVADVPDELLAEFSARTDAIRRRLDEKLDRFTKAMERKPTARERWKLEREAVVESRPPKVEPDDPITLHRSWLGRADALGWSPQRLLDATLDRAHPTADIPTTATIDRAINVLTEHQSTWRPAEALREVSAALPTDLALTAAGAVASAEAIADMTITERCVDISRPIEPGATLRHDGRPVTEAATERALTTEAILAQEEQLVAWTERRLAHAGADHPTAARHSGVELTSAQDHVATKVAGNDQVVFVIGPAGTGKTTALRPAVAQLHADGRSVFGVCPSANAAQVLAKETGADADTVDKLLVEHRLARPPEPRYDLPWGATVIVDESGMLPTANFAELAELADAHGWRLAFVGDPMQFSAVGRGGMFGHLVDIFGGVELDRVHRFENEWERAASLHLRHGDTDVAALYDAHGRLHGGATIEMEHACVQRWWEYRDARMPSLLMATTNEAVERLNQQAQRQRIRRCDLDPDGPTTFAGRYTLRIGDEIATRKNDRTIRTDRRRAVTNRAAWTVTEIHRDGSISARGKDGHVDLPVEYVREHVELAYAVTTMGAQGRTVRGGVLLIDRATDVRALYVAMTRGTATNEAFIVTDGEDRAVDVFERCLASDWIDQPAVARRAELLLPPDDVAESHRLARGADASAVCESQRIPGSSDLNVDDVGERGVPDRVGSRAKQILKEWGGGTLEVSEPPSSDDRSPARRILDEWGRGADDDPESRRLDDRSPARRVLDGWAEATPEDPEPPAFDRGLSI